MYVFVYILHVCVCEPSEYRCKTSNLAVFQFLLSNFRHFHTSIHAGGWSVLQMSPSNEDASVAQ